MRGNLEGTAHALRELDRDSLGDHIDRLFRAAWALCGSAQEAEELVQETFARVLAKPRFLRSDDDLGYLLRALRNTLVSRERLASRRPRLEPLDEGAELTDQRPGSMPEQAIEARLVYAAIAALSREFREALVAVDVAGLSYREAARALRVPEGTLTSRVFRARREVVRLLEPTESSQTRR
jgi:RNA polymerase sigma-70 factor (ECF subfamily)